MTIQPLTLVDGGLGNSAFLLDLGDGRGLVVDPSRDLRQLRGEAERLGLSIGFVAETHLHADFVSGATQLKARDGADVLASAVGNREFAHRRLADGDEVDLGGLTLRAWGTPGHTDEHLAYLLLDGQRPVGVFSGGSLLAGSAARTDLVDPERTEELARAQYRSIMRLLSLPDDVAVWPTHGAGSFCSAPAGADRVTTIGAERAQNPLLAAAHRAANDGGEDAFVATLLGGLGTYPTYFARLAEVNRLGPAIVNDRPALPQLDADDVRRRVADGAVVVDVRPVAEFGAGHIPGAISIALRDQFASWLGWVCDDTTPIVIVRDDDQDPDEIVWQALKIGYENIVGELRGGISAWTGDIATVDVLEPGDAAASLSTMTVLDVRQASEYESGHIPSSVNIELGALSSTALPDGPLLMQCGQGLRAMTAASLAARAGRPAAMVVGGAADIAAAVGTELVDGS